MNKLSAWLVLCVITVTAGLLLATTNELTKDTIASQAEQTAQRARMSVLPGAEALDEQTLSDGSALDALYVGRAGNQTVGYVAQLTIKGFGGQIELIVGADADGSVTGVNVGGADFKETAGLGAKAKDAAFTSQFIGKSAPITAKKAGETASGDSIDAITAATVTSRAVTSGVNTALDAIKRAFGRAEEEALPEGRVGEGEAQGHAGPIFARVVIDENDTIIYVKIGDERLAETAGWGDAVKDEAFTSQFIGKKGAFALADIDAVSGATHSTNGALQAVNAAYENALKAGQ